MLCKHEVVPNTISGSRPKAETMRVRKRQLRSAGTAPRYDNYVPQVRRTGRACVRGERGVVCYIRPCTGLVAALISLSIPCPDCCQLPSPGQRGPAGMAGGAGPCRTPARGVVGAVAGGGVCLVLSCRAVSSLSGGVVGAVAGVGCVGYLPYSTVL